MRSYLKKILSGEIATSNLVGRKSELKTFGLALEALRGGQGSVHVVSGPLGVGKTALLSRVAQDALDQGLVVTGTRFYDPPMIGDPPPSSKFAIALAFALAVISGRECEGEPEHETIDLVEGLTDMERAIVKELAGAREFRYIVPSAQIMAEVFPRAFASAAWKRPMVFIIEDGHLADPDARAIMTGLFQVAAMAPFCLIISGQSFKTGMFPPSPVLTNHQIQPFNRHLSGEILRRAMPGLSPEATQLILARSGGNPLHLLNSVMLEAERSGRADSKTTAPRSAVDLPGLLRTRIKAVPEDHRTLLATAAVLGQRFHPEEVMEIAGGIDSRALYLRLMYFMKHGLIVRDGRSAFRFTHPLIHRAAYTTLEREKRAPLHRAVGRQLTKKAGDRPDLWTDAARHSARAGDYASAAWQRLQAGLYFERRGMVDEAQRNFDTGLMMLERIPSLDPDLAFDLQYGAGRVRRIRGLPFGEDAKKIVIRGAEAGLSEDRRLTARSIALMRARGFGNFVDSMPNALELKDAVRSRLQRTGHVDRATWLMFVTLNYTFDYGAIAEIYGDERCVLTDHLTNTATEQKDFYNLRLAMSLSHELWVMNTAARLHKIGTNVLANLGRQGNPHEVVGLLTVIVRALMEQEDWVGVLFFARELSSLIKANHFQLMGRFVNLMIGLGEIGTGNSAGLARVRAVGRGKKDGPPWEFNIQHLRQRAYYLAGDYRAVLRSGRLIRKMTQIEGSPAFNAQVNLFDALAYAALDMKDVSRKLATESIPMALGARQQRTAGRLQKLMLSH